MAMRDKTKYIDAKRRGFLAGAAVAGGAAATGAARAVGAPAPDAPGPEAPVAPESRGYRVTEHVRRYYEKARF